jgi:hypothetical protein
MRRKARHTLPTLILLLAAVLRWHALGTAARFHPDEALFATFARQAAVNGDWLLHGPLDKPPLTIYANALSMMFTGVTTLPDGVLTLTAHRGEFAARLPGVFASILLVALLYATARRLYPHAGYSVPLVAMLLLALSPYAIAFSATAFTDNLMLLAITLALWQSAAGHWGWSGLWLAVGFGCKQQALLYIPLVLLILVNRPGTRRLAGFIRFGLPLLAGLLLLTAWDAGREQETSLWALAIANNDPGRLARLDELLPRLGVWLGYAGALAGIGGTTALLSGLAVAALIVRARTGGFRQPAIQTDLILFGYVVVYGLLHWLVAFSQHDRYLLPLLPPLLLLMARGVGWLHETGLFRSIIVRGINTFRQPEPEKRWMVWEVGTILMVMIIPVIAAWDASEGRAPVGADQGEHTGIDTLADYLNAKPVATVIYDRWLGWELGYYLGAWSDKRRVYYPTPDALVYDALLLPEHEPRYFPAPDTAPVAPWLTALRTAGFVVRVDTRIAGYTVYTIIPPAASAESASGAGSSWPGQMKPSGDWPE